MRPTDVQIDDVTRLLVHLVDLLLVLGPSLLVCLQLFVLMLPFLGKLRLLHAKRISLRFELVALRPE